MARAAYEVDRCGCRNPGQELARAGAEMQTAFDDAARTAGRVPLIGDDLARALGAGSQAGRVAGRLAGRQQIDTIETMAAAPRRRSSLVGAVPVLLVWLWVRLRYARARPLGDPRPAATTPTCSRCAR